MSDNVTSVIVIIVLVCLSAYFSATETAFTSINKIKIKNQANDGDIRAKRVMALSANYDKLLSTILIGNNIVNIAMTAVATVLFMNIYGDIGATISTVVITVVVLIFGEITPKNIAKDSPESFAMFSAPIINVCMRLLTPVNAAFSAWKRLVSRVFNVSGDNSITGEELLTIVDEAETVGGIDAEQSELIQNAIEFNDLTAEDVLTPRVDVEAIDISMSVAEVGEIFKATGFSRLPVYEDEMDNILGVIHQKDFHNYIVGIADSINDYVKPVVFIAETIKLPALLKRLQTAQDHMAIIVDEYGGTEGIVTLEDIIEELVGEIYDEHDAITSQEVTEMPNGSYNVMGSANLAKVLDFFEIDEDFDINTINGWVVLCLDKLPNKGDSFERSYDNKLLKVKVTTATARKAIDINLIVEDIETDNEIKKGDK